MATAASGGRRFTSREILNAGSLAGGQIGANVDWLTAKFEQRETRQTGTHLAGGLAVVAGPRDGPAGPRAAQRAGGRRCGAAAGDSRALCTAGWA